MAMSLLGCVALGEIGVLLSHSREPRLALAHFATPPVFAAVGAATPKPVTEPSAAEAERKLLASLPKPTPVSAQRITTTESRVSDLVNLARTLRDRGDTSTALTRLREAQVILPRNPLIISEMATTYERMGLPEKAIEQWRRIYEIGERAGIYYSAAEAKLRTFELPSVPPETAEAPVPGGGLQPERATATPNGPPVLSLGDVGIVEDTGRSQPLRQLKLRVPIQARQGNPVEVHDAVIQVYFYDQLKDGTIVQTNANVGSSWLPRSSYGVDQPVDWSSPDPEVLLVEYAQPEPDSKDLLTREHRNFFGYVVRVYYKGNLNATCAAPSSLLKQFPPPTTLLNSDLPQ